MEFRNLEITVSCAKDLRNVNTFSKMDVYVIAMIAEDPRSNQKTPIDKDGGKSPKWNHKMKFIIDVSSAKQNRCTLVFQIKSDRSLGDRDIGEVTVHVKDLLIEDDDKNAGEKNLTYKVILPSGKEKGTFNFSYKLGEKLDMPAVAPIPIMAEKHVGGDEPVMAYPTVAPGGPNYGYQQPQQPGFGLPSPPPPMYYQPPPPGSGPPPPMYYQPQPPAGGYGYPMQQGYPPQMAPGGYLGYPAPAQYGYAAQEGKQKKKKSGMGGLGMGLGAGLLGGLLIGDMVSDVGEMAAYDDAMGDGGFDF